MTPKLHESAGRVQFDVIEKLTSACYFIIARETMLLLVNKTRRLLRRSLRLPKREWAQGCN